MPLSTFLEPMALRKSTIAAVYAALDSSSFTAADFEIRANISASEFLVVTFRSDTQYGFSVVEQTDIRDQVSLYITRSPGEQQDTEHLEIVDLTKVPAMLTSWTRFLRTELRAALPVYDEIDDLRRKIEDHISNHVKEPNERFSIEEADVLREQLATLSAKFEEMQEEHKLNAQQVQKLQAQLHVLTEDLKGFHKGTWYRTAATKLWSMTTALATSPEGRKVLTQAAQHALGVDQPHP
jgi:hypothetical protein